MSLREDEPIPPTCYTCSGPKVPVNQQLGPGWLTVDYIIYLQLHINLVNENPLHGQKPSHQATYDAVMHGDRLSKMLRTIDTRPDPV